MTSWLASVASSCWLRMTCREEIELDESDPLIWSRDGRHSAGEFSFAVCQANAVLEDHSQVEIAPNALFVGVYDGHGGPTAAEYVNNHLFDELLKVARRHGNISQVTVEGAIACVENNFLNFVRHEQRRNSALVCMGTCCLAGVIYKGTLLVANLGDSRAVIAYTNNANKIIAEPLTVDHNVNREEIRQEFTFSHPEDPDIVVHRNRAFRVKGLLQVCRAIGDAYLKRDEFEVDPALERFQIREPIRAQPVLSAQPALHSRLLQRRDRFIIFASDGLWDNLSNQEAVEIVHKYPARDIAKRLIKAAQKVAARKVSFPYEDLKGVNIGDRREIHDDITVVVVFLYHDFLGKKIPVQESSHKGFSDVLTESNFVNIDDLM